MPDAPKTRISLILRLKQPADAEAWQQFCEIYQPLIFRIARSKGLQVADANDLTQEVLVRVARSIEHWDPSPQKGSFRGWIRKIARNLIIDFLRSKKQVLLSSDHSDVLQLIEEAPSRSTESEFFDAEFEKQLFAWAAEKIKPSFQTKTWLAFWQTAVEQRTVTEVARELEMTTGALYVARSRVIARLRETVEKIETDQERSWE